jgi:O-antigen/teichoic acid export membrane protein
MTHAVPSMTNRTLSGLFWMSLASGANVVALLLVLVVLARMLTPADFGLAAVALMVIGFSAIFSEFGIGPAVVQRPDLRPAHLRSGFTLSFFLGVLLGAITWLLAPLVAEFFQLAELTPILRTLSWIFPVQSLAVVSESLLQRELRFRCLALLDVVAAVLGYGVLGICLAMLGCGAWALVGAQMAQAIIKTVLLLCVRPHEARPLFDRRACADLLYFGGGFTAGRFSNYAAGQGEHVVIGYCLGAVALGVYGRAYQLMAGPAVLFGNVLDRVLFPAMVQVQDQPSRLAHAYRRGTALIALVILPTSAVLVALAPEVIAVLLGPEWHSVTLPLQILGVGMLFRTGCKISDSLVRATGAVYRRTWRQTAYAVLVVAGAWLGQHWGIEGVALAILVTLAINFLLMAQLGLGLARMSWRTFAAAHVPGLAFAALVGMPVVAAAELLRAADQSPVAVLVFSTCACIPAVLLAGYFPRIFLGEDGTWMARHLKAFLVQARHTANSSAATSAVAGPSRQPAAAAGSLLGSLVGNLASHGIRYCRWKRPLNLERVLKGDGDLDLLLDANQVDEFLRLAEGLGFRRLVSCFEPCAAQEMHLYGLDHDTGALLHLHVHSSLFGNFWGNVAPALDELVLRHSSPEGDASLLEGMPVVQPGAEQIVIVLRAMEQYARLSNLPALVAHKRRLQAKLHAGLKTAAANQACLALLERWLPAVPTALFAECRTALAEPTSWLCRYRLARQLHRRVRGASAVLGSVTVPRLPDQLKALWWRLYRGSGSPKQLPLGGSVIAFIGPDASGKSTMVAETTQLLGRVFRVEAAHLHRPG